jgi:tRNA pseudouridine32 synthase / 23S rRNA pseudouridine746 synthase
MMSSNNQYVKLFNTDISGIEVPEKFTFPFYYEPHPLAILAARELQKHIVTQKVWAHNFGLPGNDLSLQDGVPIGKMFGVLVVENSDGVLGYLQAFSGKLADSNDHEGFVPPVYDMLKEGDFFRQAGKEIVEINKKLEAAEENHDYLEALANFKTHTVKEENELLEKKKKLKENKKARKTLREKARLRLDEKSFKALEEKLKDESLKQQYFFKKDAKESKERLAVLEKKLLAFTHLLDELKQTRKLKSFELQNKLFKEYTFLNEDKEQKSLLSIFKETVLKKPPAGAGECAAPKLLQYAFLHHLKPIALAEFWWGTSPSAAIKKHLHYYPACKSKCEPILEHMLSATKTDANPLLINLAKDKEIEILHEDSELVIINKPTELLSVPGKTIKDSVQTRMRAKYPNATGPLIVHRLDMSTSGIMLIPLTKKAHDFLQKQFITRKIRKRYAAQLEGIVESDQGKIDLPLRLDLDDRPKQLVCFDHGKAAQTTYQVIERLHKRTRVYFYPLTGRTHQLRVHASHKKGLDCAIVGDDLYGSKGERLHLHAESIEFCHPSSKEKFKIRCKEKF